MSVGASIVRKTIAEGMEMRMELRPTNVSSVCISVFFSKHV